MCFTFLQFPQKNRSVCTFACFAFQFDNKSREQASQRGGSQYKQNGGLEHNGKSYADHRTIEPLHHAVSETAVEVVHILFLLESIRPSGRCSVLAALWPRTCLGTSGHPSIDFPQIRPDFPEIDFIRASLPGYIFFIKKLFFLKSNVPASDLCFPFSN